MRKSTVFISAVLTTFALVMLYRVVLAYRDNQQTADVTAQPTATLAPTATESPAPTDTVISPEDAAKLAAQVVGNANLLSAETASFNGTDAYLITFTNRDIVYVGLDGQILGVQVAPVVVNANVSAPVNKKHKNNNDSGSQNVGSGSGVQQEHQEQEHD